MLLNFGSRSLDLSYPHVMGILNVTPDSFSDGGRFFGSHGVNDAALIHAENMVNEGATFIDIGGESTRPGASPVSVQQELDRVLPVVEALAKRVDCVISVDTSTPELISAAASLGAGLINDVRALQKHGALKAAADTGLPVCLMHMRGQPTDMQNAPVYNSVVDEVSAFLEARHSACVQAGIDQNAVLLDPGFGFGKTDSHNLTLLKRLNDIRVGDSRLLVGLSRKSLIGRLLGRDVGQRLAGSLALAQYALQYGASILRVHDVAPTMDIVKIFQSLQMERI